jgi:hypothetical protein
MPSVEITIHPRRITFRHSDGSTGGDTTPTSLARAELLSYYFRIFSENTVYLRVETETFAD